MKRDAARILLMTGAVVLILIALFTLWVATRGPVRPCDGTVTGYPVGVPTLIGKALVVIPQMRYGCVPDPPPEAS